MNEDQYLQPDVSVNGNAQVRMNEERELTSEEWISQGWGGVEIGDYCREQHQLICRMELYIDLMVEHLSKKDRKRTEKEEYKYDCKLAFLVTQQQSCSQEIKEYHANYPAWLEKKRKG